MTQELKQYFNLWNKEGEYSKEEISFLKSYIKKQNFKVNYGFYNKVSAKKMQIAVVFDLIPGQGRKTGVENNWEIIASRTITDKEVEEFIHHYFKASFKRFLVFYYKNIEKLIFDDNRLNANTPSNFIDECKKKGYSGDYQLKINYNSVS
jgi:hypothetical protein